MQTKILEVRDRMTRIVIVAINMDPLITGDFLPDFIASKALHSQGYAPDHTHILLGRVDGTDFTNDPYKRTDRTLKEAHIHIQEMWEELQNGDVVDVEYILGETKEPKSSSYV